MAGGGTTPKELALSLDELPCGVMRMDDSGRILGANRTFCDWIGYPCADLVGHMKFQDLMTVGARIFHHTHWAPLLRLQGSVSEVKLDLRCRSGTTLPVVVNAVRREADGVAFNDVALFVARDRDTYEQELVRAKAEQEKLTAESRDRALFAEQMMGIVSHDLRNPLSTIGTAAYVLSRDDSATDRAAMVGAIKRATERASRLIVDLLDFTQARLGQGLSVNIVPGVELHALCDGVIADLRIAFPKADIRHVAIGPAAVTADADRLAQALGNLIANAITYGDVAAPITVTSEVGDSAARLAVHNRGAPIAPGMLARIFQPMTRGSDAPGAGRSVGLGLFIVSEIARAHRGGIAVASTQEDGTLFTLSIPRA